MNIHTYTFSSLLKIKPRIERFTNKGMIPTKEICWWEEEDNDNDNNNKGTGSGTIILHYYYTLR